MARWKLNGKHYLNVPGTEWEHKEISLSSGKQVRKIYTVPAFLDPAEPGDCNYPGEIIVCHEGKGERKDIVFLGDPTTEMEPLDEEAEEISAQCARMREHPIETMSARLAPPQNVSGVDPKAFEALAANVQALMQANEELRSRLALAEAPPAPVPAARRL